MTATSFSPLAAAQELEAVGIERHQAEAIANAINHGSERAANKTEVESLIASVRSELVATRWLGGIQVAVVLAVITLGVTIGWDFLDKVT